MTKRLFLAAMGAGSLIALAAPAYADVKAGVDAWGAGDYATAVREWAQPAADGDPDAQFNLAQAYRLGRGVQADPRQAEALYALAARQGHIKAADNYGLLLFQDNRREEALPYIQAASERGDPRAQYLLGVAHFNGDLVAKDWVRAYALTTLANSAGLPQARTAIGQMDEYIPLAQREEAQLLARTLKSDAEALRASEMAAVDLATGTTQAEVRAASDTAPRAAAPVPRSTTAPVVVSTRGNAGADFSLPAGTGTRAAPPATPPTAARPVTPRPVRAAAATPAATPASRPASRPAATPAPAAAAGGEWKVQLGAFGVAGNADRLWDRLSGSAALRGAVKIKEPAGRLTKLLAGGFASQADASRACAALKSSGQDCLVVR